MGPSATPTSSVTSLETGSGSRASSEAVAETGPSQNTEAVQRAPCLTGWRRSTDHDDGGDEVVVGAAELELCRRELAAERLRWADEKRIVVEYQLRLQAYCRQLAERNQQLEDRLRTMSVELGRSSSGYGSDSTGAALVSQLPDDGSVLTSTL